MDTWLCQMQGLVKTPMLGTTRTWGTPDHQRQQGHSKD